METEREAQKLWQTQIADETKLLYCAVCREPFLFTSGEQEYFKRLGLQNPKRCPDCRKCGRQLRNEQPKQRTWITCAECRVQTTVPFVPEPERPVFCKTCHVKRSHN